MSHRSGLGVTLALAKTWYLELLCSLVAIGCLGAIVVLLLVHQNKVIPKRVEILSINSLISIVSALYRASLLMPIAEGKSILHRY